VELGPPSGKTEMGKGFMGSGIKKKLSAKPITEGVWGQNGQRGWQKRKKPTKRMFFVSSKLRPWSDRPAKRGDTSFLEKIEKKKEKERRRGNLTNGNLDVNWRGEQTPRNYRKKCGRKGIGELCLKEEKPVKINKNRNQEHTVLPRRKKP